MKKKSPVKSRRSIRPARPKATRAASRRAPKSRVTRAAGLSDSQAIAGLYFDLLGAWNDRQARKMASLYAPSGGQVGFDGSSANGPAEIEALLTPIFKDHPTARFVAKVREIRVLGQNAGVLRAVAGMIAPGQADLHPDRNTVQTLVVSRTLKGRWRIEMFHNTPARFDGRPEEGEKLTAELRELLS